MPDHAVRQRPAYSLIIHNRISQRIGSERQEQEKQQRLCSNEAAHVVDVPLLSTCPMRDTVYLMFLDTAPTDENELDKKSITAFQDIMQAKLFELVDRTVRRFQAPPHVSHVELLLFNDLSRVRHHFATYLFEYAKWRLTDSYYKVNPTGVWRAVPIVWPGIGDKVRQECDEHKQTPYSIVRYLTTLQSVHWLVRKLPGFFVETRKHKAHCSNLTSRILQIATRELSNGSTSFPPDIACTYGPSRLYNTATAYVEQNSGSCCQWHSSSGSSGSGSVVVSKHTQITPTIIAVASTTHQAIHEP